MPPVKFGDFEKTAKETINDDFQINGLQLKAKQKTSWNATVLTTTVDIPTSKPEGHWTPSKMSFKFPGFFGINGLTVDKLEMDKSGKFAFESTMDDCVHTVQDLKMELKSNLKDVDGITAGFTYTGIKDTQVKFETKLLKPDQATAEITRSLGDVTAGLKIAPTAAGAYAVDVGARFAKGDFFAALVAKNKMDVLGLWGCYTKNDLKVSGSYQVAPKNEKEHKKAAVALAYAPKAGSVLKLKADEQKNVYLSFKHQIEKGLTAVFGMHLKLKDTSKKDFTWGAQLSIE